MKIFFYIIFFTAIVSGTSVLINPIPQEVPFDAAKANLGKRLFFDPLVSYNDKTSCADCHIKSAYIKKSQDYYPLFNTIFNIQKFHPNEAIKDANNISYQSIHNPSVMGIRSQLIEKKLNMNVSYQKEFQAIYGSSEVAFVQVVDVLGEFQKALLTPNSKFDQYLRGKAKLTDTEMKGFLTFKKLGCVTCHNGINLGGNSYQKYGLVNEVDVCMPKVDRYTYTQNEEDRNVFKVPSLRNIVQNAPYFHDKSALTLKEAIMKMSYHNVGLQLSKVEIEALIDFMKTLTGDTPRILK